MMLNRILPASLWLLCLSAVGTRGKTTTNEFYSTTFSTLSTYQSTDFTGSQFTYNTQSGQSTVQSSNGTGTSSSSSSSSSSQSTKTSTTQSLTLLGGNNNNTATSTETGAQPSNTLPCNGYPEFCNRQYSNITEVCSHNSAFVRSSNAGSNQVLPIVDQLNDGIRMRKYRSHALQVHEADFEKFKERRIGSTKRSTTAIQHVIFLMPDLGNLL